VNEPAPELRQVRLLNLPVQLWVDAKQHNDELLREFTLIATAKDSPAEGHAVPERLLAVITTLRQQYGQGSSERDARIFAANAAGIRQLDMVVELPRTAAPALRNLAELLDDADEFCRSGQHLLTLATPPELVAYRRWYLRELAMQLEGAAPTPWSESPPQP
jgi:hypothetical protein